MNYTPNFLIAADHRIELALLGPFDQVDAVLFEGLELALGALVGHAGAAANGLERLEHGGLVDGVELEDVSGLGVDLGEGEQQVLGRGELVLHRVGLFLGGFEHLDGALAEAGHRPARGLGQVAEFGVEDALELAYVRADFFEDRADNAVGFGHQRGQQVDRFDLRVAAIGGQFLRALDGLLGFDREFVEPDGHDPSPRWMNCDVE